MNKIISWFLLVFTLGSAYVISQIEAYSLWFLILLIANMGFAVFFAKKIDRTVLNIARILLGALFIYSGIVKGVDPLGTQFKIEDYFFAYGTDWAVPYALILSVIMNAAEFSLGALLLLRIKTKWVSILTMLMMLMFTITTLYDALYSPVPDCGCFGDALIITNWQTFYKNLVINVFVIWVLIRRESFSLYKNKVLEIAGLLAIISGFVVFENYNIQNLPVIDFRSWKVGNRLIPKNPKPVEYFLTYKNKTTGEEKEFLSQDLPWRDTIFMAEWAWASSREVDPNIAETNIFPMIDYQGNDVAKELVSDINYVFIFVIYDIKKVDAELANPINDIYAKAQAKGYNVVMLNSDMPEDYARFVSNNNLAEMPVYNSDDTALKAAIRSNPGLIIVKDGEVIQKYHHNNFEDVYEYLK